MNSVRMLPQTVHEWLEVCTEGHAACGHGYGACIGIGMQNGHALWTDIVDKHHRHAA